MTGAQLRLPSVAFVLHHFTSVCVPPGHPPSMPRWEPMHPDFLEALGVLAGLRIGYAEALRALIPVAERLDQPRPSYWRVRRFLMAERRRRRLRADRRDQIISDVLAGLVMRPLFDATQAIRS
jgi:hypothetical protein